MAAGPNVWVHVGELPERNLAAVVAVDEQRADGVEGCRGDRRAAGPRGRTALAEPDLRLLLADEADSDRADHVARRQADARRGLAVDGDLQLRQAR